MSRVNWLKVGANAGVAFFSVLAGTLTVNAICQADVPLRTLILAAVFSGLIQAGLAFFKELAKSVGSPPIADRGGGSGSSSLPQSKAGGNPGGHAAMGVCQDLREAELAFRRCMRKKKAWLVLNLMTMF